MNKASLKGEYYYILVSYLTFTLLCYFLSTEDHDSTSSDDDVSMSELFARARAQAHGRTCARGVPPPEISPTQVPPRDRSTSPAAQRSPIPPAYSPIDTGDAELPIFE